MTYSIVARDAATGQLGVAVQSRYFSTGSVVTWAEAGVGAVATQSFARIDYGPELLALMRDGREPQSALDALVAADEGRAVRQVACVDAAGRVAVHTGAMCIADAGHIAGDGYCVQAILSGEIDAARAAFARAVELAPEDEQLQFFAGLALLRCGDDAGGARLLRSALATAPGFADLVPRLVPLGMVQPEMLDRITALQR